MFSKRKKFPEPFAFFFILLFPTISAQPCLATVNFVATNQPVTSGPLSTDGVEIDVCYTIGAGFNCIPIVISTTFVSQDHDTLAKGVTYSYVTPTGNVVQQLGQCFDPNQCSLATIQCVNNVPVSTNWVTNANPHRIRASVGPFVGFVCPGQVRRFIVNITTSCLPTASPTVAPSSSTLFPTSPTLSPTSPTLSPTSLTSLPSSLTRNPTSSTSLPSRQTTVTSTTTSQISVLIATKVVAISQSEVRSISKSKSLSVSGSQETLSRIKKERESDENKKELKKQRSNLEFFAIVCVSLMIVFIMCIFVYTWSAYRTLSMQRKTLRNFAKTRFVTENL